MKQLKQNQFKNAKTTTTSTLRHEIDHCVKDIAARVSKDPKKAVKIFESWIEGKTSSPKKKKAA